MKLSTMIRAWSRTVPMGRHFRGIAARHAHRMRTYAPRHEVKAYTWECICNIVQPPAGNA
jgi:hypothetical protein